MRNLKKILALVLALMMIVSMMVFASAASYEDYEDADQVNPAYAEAVEVLTGMGVFEGYDGGFHPTDKVTRAEVSAVLYRALTADVTDAESGRYKGYGDFSDVGANQWYAGYVGYMANGEWIVGDGQGHYMPEDNVTGYELLKIVLRAIGYGANKEFVGGGWDLHVATVAREQGITDGYEGGPLSEDLTREEVAYLVFKALDVDKVKYTPAMNYVDDRNGTTIGWDEFGLDCTDTLNIDVWGRPGYYWFRNADKVVDSAYNSNTDAVYAVIEYEALHSNNVAETECDVAEVLGLEKTVNSIDVYLNGYLETTYESINPLATTAKLGAQGQVMEFYDADQNGVVDRIVYVDTYLAEVAEVKNATFDDAGHLKTSSELTLNVYTSEIGTAPTSNRGVPENVTLYGGADNYTYTKGQMLLVNAVDNANDNIAEIWSTDYKAYTPYHLDILQVAEAMVGAQTKIWWNAEKHTVNNQDYDDAVRFYLDEANDQTTSHTWYKDQFGNLIGATDIVTQYTYGVISSMWWAGDAATGTGVARATLTYMDGSTATVTLGLIDDDGVDNGKLGYVPVAGYDSDAMSARKAQSATVTGEIAVASTAYINATSSANSGHGYIGGHMFQFEVQADGTVAAYKVTKELAAANVNTGVSAVTGNYGTFYTNSNTVYLVRSGVAGAYTYASVTGYNNIGNYSVNNDVTVDYVMADGTYARYVYITGTADDVDTDAFVMSTGNNYSATLKTMGGISYYEFTYGLNMDGTTNTMKVLASAKAAVIDKMVNSVGKLFKIDYRNGFATLATEVDADASAGNNTDNIAGAYTAVFLGNDVTATADALYNADGVLGTTYNNTHYNVTNSTVVIGGTLADLATAGKNVYIVYATANSNVVTHIYITNFAKNTVADAQAALANTNYGTITVYGETAGANLNAVVLAQVNAKLAAAGVTGVTATLNPVYPVNAPAVGSSSDNWFEIVLSDVFGGTASIGGNYVKVVNENTTAGLSKTIKDHLEGMTSVKANMTKGQVETQVTARIGQVASTTNLTINVTLPTTMQAGEIVTVVVAGTVNGVVVNTTAQVVVQSTT